MIDLELPIIEMFDPSGSERVHARIAELQEQGHWIAHNGYWPVVLTYADAQELWRDPRFATLGVAIMELQGVTSGPLYDRTRRALLNLEGEAHARIRRLVSHAFTPKAVAPLRPVMRAYIDERLDELAPRGHFELMADLAVEYPIVIICAIVGAPREDWPLFSAWAESIMKQFNYNLAEDLPEIEAALDELDAYVSALVEARRASPADDLLSSLIAAEEDGDRLTNRELVDMVMGLLLAGTDTTRHQLGLGMLWFARNPDQWERIAASPDSVVAATEEVVRFDPTASGTLRIATEDVTHRGVTFPAGSSVYLLSTAANRDPELVACPHVFDAAADRGTFTPLTFGTGRHYCLGANLARAELQEAFTGMAARLTNLRLDGQPDLKPFMSVYGPSRLPLAFDPR